MPDLFYDQEFASIRITNERKGKIFISIVDDKNREYFEIEKEDKPEFVDFLKRLIKEIEKG
jgi:hypothetical protein